MTLENNFVGKVIAHPTLGELTVTEQTDHCFKTTGTIVPFMMFYQTKCRFKDDNVQNLFLSEPNMEDKIKETYKDNVKPEVLRTYINFYRTTMKLAYEGSSIHYIE